MADAHGFMATVPDDRYAKTSSHNLYGNYIYGQSFTLGDVGSVQLTQIGGYFARLGAETDPFKMAVYTDDAANACPESLVANSVASLSATESYATHCYAEYTTKPQLSGNTTYWLVMFAPGEWNVDGFDGGEITTVYLSSTYDSFLEGAAWHSKGTVARDYGIYAVYEAVSTSQFARPSSDVTDGNWLNEADSGTNLYASIDEETASDVDYIKSGASPANDTCTVGLGAISTPVSGTTTMRIRAKFL